MNGGFEIVKSAVPMRDAVRFYGGVELDRAGRGRCPVCGSTNKSCFSVKGDYATCFRCNWHGDVIKLTQDLNGDTTPYNALKRLASDWGVDIPDNAEKPPDAVSERLTAIRAANAERELIKWAEGVLWDRFRLMTAIRDTLKPENTGDVCLLWEWATVNFAQTKFEYENIPPLDFREKVAYFENEQDKLTEYDIQNYAAEKTLAAEIRRKANEQYSKFAV